jgi:GMP synthase-like glutamine amidotransferase
MLPPSGFPEGWTGLGKSTKCTVQGAYQPSRVLTYQGHFEFDCLINTETVKAFRDKWDSEVVQQFLEDIDADDDSLVAAEILLKFLLEEPYSKSPQCKI